ncbi:IS3 family transposase [Mycoplasmopsis arginini]|uniref:IS3 family transposase n=1 Tax=Mycoplasmopsis arginini TaxID=2094 RepID=A0ABZ2AMD0_MYCAR|nr:IS3 family transposase [Mycoplasmopsis arginini]WVN22178.1 IS3 family transposase [Mycoplasmopsis arginini]VEU81584.1 transposase, IS861 [Mycoplasmopsis arginini]
MQIKIKELEERNSQLEMENDLLKKLRALVLQRKQQQKKEKVIVVYESRHKYQFKSMLVFFKLSKSTYFYILKSFKKIDKDSPIKDLILEIFKKNKSRYGYRRITLELKNRGFVVNHKKVRRLMNELNIFGIKPKAKYKSYKGKIGKTCKNLLLNKIIDKQKNITFFERNFKTEKSKLNMKHWCFWVSYSFRKTLPFANNWRT